MSKRHINRRALDGGKQWSSEKDWNDMLMMNGKCGKTAGRLGNWTQGRSFTKRLLWIYAACLCFIGCIGGTHFIIAETLTEVLKSYSIQNRHQCRQTFCWLAITSEILTRIIISWKRSRKWHPGVHTMPPEMLWDGDVRWSFAALC